MFPKNHYYDEATEYFKTILQCQRRLHGPFHQDVAAALHNCGLAQLRAGHHHHAQKSFEEAVRIRKGTLGKEHPHVAVSFAWKLIPSEVNSYPPHHLTKTIHSITRHHWSRVESHSCFCIDLKRRCGASERHCLFGETHWGRCIHRRLAFTTILAACTWNSMSIKKPDAPLKEHSIFSGMRCVTIPIVDRFDLALQRLYAI